jgi:hypothetical protein
MRGLKLEDRRQVNTTRAHKTGPAAMPHMSLVNNALKRRHKANRAYRRTQLMKERRLTGLVAVRRKRPRSARSRSRGLRARKSETALRHPGWQCRNSFATVARRRCGACSLTSQSPRSRPERRRLRSRRMAPGCVTLGTVKPAACPSPDQASMPPGVGAPGIGGTGCGGIPASSSWTSRMPRPTWLLRRL